MPDTDISVGRITHILIFERTSVSEHSAAVTDTEPLDIVEGIESGSMHLSRILAEEQIVFGKPFASMFEVSIHDLSTNIKGKEILVYQVDNSDENNPINIPIFNGIIDTVEYEKTSDTRHIVAYDQFYTLSQKDVSSWWNAFLHASDPQVISPADYVKDLCDYCDVIYDDDEVYDGVSADIVISGEELSKISFTNMLQYLTQYSCVIPYFDSVNDLVISVENSEVERRIIGINRLRFCRLGDNYSVDDTDLRGRYETQNSEYADNITEIPRRAVLLDKNGRTIDPLSAYPDTGVNYIIPYSPILDKGSQRITATAVTLMLRTEDADDPNAYMYKDYYTSFIKMIVSDPTIPLGSRIRLDDDVYSYALQIDLSGPMLIEQEIRCMGNSNQLASEIVDNSTPTSTIIPASTDWQDLTLATGITAVNQGGVATPKIRKVGDRVDVVGAVRVTWDGSTTTNLITDIPSDFRPTTGTHNWIAASEGRAVDLCRLATGTNGSITLFGIRSVTDGSATTAQRWIELNTSWFVI